MKRTKDVRLKRARRNGNYDRLGGPINCSDQSWWFYWGKDGVALVAPGVQQRDTAVVMLSWDNLKAMSKKAAKPGEEKK